jgi:hypothetical protein
MSLWLANDICLASDNDMTACVRHCVECPKCLTRYLVGFSPYRNGSYLAPLAKGLWEEWTLYCSCGLPSVSSRWRWTELRPYFVSKQAHVRGYGSPEEIVALRGSLRRRR